MNSLLSAIVACGLAGLLMTGSWFAAVGIYFGIPPHETYSASMTDRFYHADPHCPNRKTADPVVPFENAAHAERFGTACPTCVGARASRTASQSSRP